ncbi:MAG: class I SAM-dependent methyltransferase [Patescibacteria group bacterium]|nr:class I SAM-dependent methyltransferase [Patescibacteria group bacterium]MCL5431600.1 class I SAM-dependent methyltransferase [Patescibacteria group bacterium]
MIQFGADNELSRKKWIKKHLLAISKNRRILDAGAGECIYKRYCSHLEYVAQDFGKYNGNGNLIGLQKTRWNLSKIQIKSDISSIPEPNVSFDAILCSEVLEHVPKPLLAIKEFARLLKPGGQLLLTAPFCSFTHFAPYFFNTGFSRYFYEVNLPEYGFQIKEIEPNGNYFSFLAQELHRLDDIVKVYSKGKLTKLEKSYINRLLIALRRFSKTDRSSSELLTFGYHVLAIKE